MLSVIWLAVVMVALIISACDGGSENEGTSDQTRQIGGPSGTELAAVQVIHIGNGAEPQTLDPHRAEGVP